MSSALDRKDSWDTKSHHQSFLSSLFLFAAILKSERLVTQHGKLRGIFSQTDPDEAFFFYDELIKGELNYRIQQRLLQDGIK